MEFADFLTSQPQKVGSDLGPKSHPFTTVLHFERMTCKWCIRLTVVREHQSTAVPWWPDRLQEHSQLETWVV